MSLRTDISKQQAQPLLADGGIFPAALTASQPQQPAPLEAQKGSKRKAGKDDKKKPGKDKTGDLTLPALENVLEEASSFAETLSVELGKASATMTRLKACGCGNDIAAHIEKEKDQVESTYLEIKKLSGSHSTDTEQYLNAMNAVVPHFRDLKKNIRIATALISASEPKKKKAKKSEVAEEE